MLAKKKTMRFIIIELGKVLLMELQGVLNTRFPLFKLSFAQIKSYLRCVYYINI